MTERLVVKGLSKQYGTFNALAPTDLTLMAGETVILSGQNGSGKTTLLTCIANLVKPSSGSVTVDSYDMAVNEIEVRKRLVFVPDVQRFLCYHDGLGTLTLHCDGEQCPGRL